jgi:hypothetical protein
MDYEPSKGEKAAIYAVLGLIVGFGIIVLAFMGWERIDETNDVLSAATNIIKYGALLVGAVGGFWLIVSSYTKGDKRDS